MITGRSALKIAKKLDAEIKKGGKHDRAEVRIKGVYIGSFGIRRNKNLGHDFIPQQIHVATKDALGLAKCTLYKEDYEKILKERGKLPNG